MGNTHARDSAPLSERTEGRFAVPNSILMTCSTFHMAKLTILNVMAGENFARALDTHRALGLRALDLKDRILGKSLVDLTDGEASQAAELIGSHGMEVYCFSRILFHPSVERGESP